MKIEIDTYTTDKEYNKELFTMFKLLCDNINTNGIKCVQVKMNDDTRKREMDL